MALEGSRLASIAKEVAEHKEYLAEQARFGEESKELWGEDWEDEDVFEDLDEQLEESASEQPKANE